MDGDRHAAHKPSSFIQQMPELVELIDIDTTRYLEYFWAFRIKNGFESTGVITKRLMGSEEFTMEQVRELFKDLNFVNVYKSDEVFRGFILEESNPDVPKFILHIVRYEKGNPYSIVMAGDETLVESFRPIFVTPPQKKNCSVVSGIAPNGQLTILDRQFEEKTDSIGFDEFYPFIEGGVEQLVEDFHAARESVLLLIGEWGTGKSTLIRTLVLKSSFKQFGLCADQPSFEHPSFIAWMSMFQKDSMVALEDADNFVASRAEGNRQMSALLSLTDGVLESNHKLIISTNLSSVNKVDPALLRPGRLFKKIEFRKLTIAEANAARAAIKLDPLPVDELVANNVTKLTLSEALNYERANNVHTQPKRQVGFIDA